MKTISNNKGETFIETLISLLVLVIVITGFSAVFETVARINHDVRNERLSLNYSEEKVADSKKWTISISDTSKKYSGDYKKVQGYTDENEKLYYYE